MLSFTKAVSATVLILVSSMAARAADEITCSSPVRPGESAQSLKKRFGADAKVDELPGAEGATIKGIVLFGDDAARRVEVMFGDDDTRMAKAVSVTIRNPGEPGDWSVRGLRVGASVSDVEKANGKPFEISGFGWDYGGFVNDFKGGALSKPLDGKCNVTIRFGKDDGAPASISGDGRTVASDNRTLLKWAPKVEEISVQFPTE